MASIYFVIVSVAFSYILVLASCMVLLIHLAEYKIRFNIDFICHWLYISNIGH